MTMMMTGGRLSGLYPNEPRTCICLLNLQHAAHAAFAPTASDLAARRPLARTKTPSTIHVQDDVHMHGAREIQGADGGKRTVRSATTIEERAGWGTCHGAYKQNDAWNT